MCNIPKPPNHAQCKCQIVSCTLPQCAAYVAGSVGGVSLEQQLRIQSLMDHAFHWCRNRDYMGTGLKGNCAIIWDLKVRAIQCEKMNSASTFVRSKT